MHFKYRRWIALWKAGRSLLKWTSRPWSRATATDGTGPRVQGRCRHFPDCLGSTDLSPGSPRRGILGLSNFRLAIFGLAVTAMMALGHIGGAAAHWKNVAPLTNFIDVFWRVGAFQRGGSKPEVVVACRRWFLVWWRRFLDGCDCLRSARSVRTHTSRTAFPAATRENIEIDLARPGKGRIRLKTTSRTPGTTRNGPAFTDEIYHSSKTRLIDITRPHCATWESCRRVFSTD